MMQSSNFPTGLSIKHLPSVKSIYNLTLLSHQGLVEIHKYFVVNIFGCTGDHITTSLNDIGCSDDDVTKTAK